MTEIQGIALSRLPVLPLRGLTAFPNMIVHFDVGRLLSIRALEAAMKNGQTIFLTAQRDLKTDNPSPSDLYQIGTICQVKQILRLPGDNIRVLVEGKQRALVHQFFAAQDDKTCIYAEVEQLVRERVSTGGLSAYACRDVAAIRRSTAERDRDTAMRPAFVPAIRGKIEHIP